MNQSNLHHNDPFQAVPEGGQIEFKEILYLFLRNWYWFLLALLITGAGAWMYLRYVDTIYSIKGNLLIKDDRATSGFSEQVISEEFGFKENSNVENEIQFLKSRSLMGRVVDSLGINISYIVEGRVKNSEIYQSLPVVLKKIGFKEKAYGRSLRLRINDSNQFTLLLSDQDTSIQYFDQAFELYENTWQIDVNPNFANPGAIIQINIQDPAHTSAFYSSQVVVQGVGRSDILALTLNDPVPDKAMDIINTLITVYNNSLLEDKQRSGKKTLDFIDERLDSITLELNAIERQVEGFKQNREIPTALSDGAGRILDQLTAQDNRIAELALQLQLLTQIEAFFKADSNRYDFLPVASEILNGPVALLVNSFNELILERKQLLTTATIENPAVELQLDQIDQTKTLILLNVANTRLELEQRKRLIEERLGPLQDKVNAVPRNERELLQIMRQQQIKANLFLYLLQRREETALSLSAQVANSRIIDPAINTGAIKPKRKQIYFIALLLGMAIPAGTLFLLFSANDRIYTEKDIREMTHTPLLGTIGSSNKEEKIVVSSGSRTAIAEMFRLLRTNLQFIVPEIETPVFLVTSALSGEGKTFVSANLGMSIALSGKKTLLMGLDLRKPKLSKYISDQALRPGLTNYLIGDAPFEEVVHRTTLNENLFLAPSGPIPPNPSELLMKDLLKQFLDQALQEFDCIVIDTAPVGLVTDALIVGKWVHAALFVTRFGKSKKETLKLAEQIYSNNKLPQLGIIMNGVKKSPRRYGYGYGYGYGSGYGYGYYEDDKKRSKSIIKKILGRSE